MKGMNLAIRSEIHSILSEALEPYFEQHYEDCWLESPINLDNLVIHEDENCDDCECFTVVKAMNWILAGKG
jgi:hypothetical protein